MLLAIDRPQQERGNPVDLVRRTILSAVEQDKPMSPAADAQVQRAIDLLRFCPGTSDTLSRLETISCALVKMHQAQRDGRVNAYASTLLRISRAAEAL
jgi:hypothetical protein